MRHKFVRASILAALLSVFITPIESYPAQKLTASRLIVKLHPRCTSGSFKQPNGPFTVLVFCEDALGNYIALYYRESMGAPAASQYLSWTLDNRVWQDKKWGSDVSGFAWSPSGKFLYVATDDIYGEGGIFEIDLANRVSKRIFPVERTDQGYGYCTEILDLDEKALSLKIRESIYTETEGKVITNIRKITIQK